MIKRFLKLMCVLSVGLFTSCSNNDAVNNEKSDLMIAVDEHTLSNYAEIQVKHLSLDIEVDFQQKMIKGFAVWSFKNTKGANQLILDTKDLQIDSIKGADGSLRQYSLGNTDAILGTALKIDLQKDDSSIQIFYSSSPNATALQWLSASQTFDKQHPFLYTQSESIHARTWIPCQDGPGIRYTYDAKVKVPQGLMALMSADNPQHKSADGVYTFKMDKPVPSYLMALAVGDIVFKPIDERSGIYAEPSMLEKAYRDFDNVGEMISVAEKLYGPYQWGRYDAIILPLGFPIGGMENPKLTFCTPTILTGDKSLMNLVAHELAHSWSGNLVTNATWNDFWLNEGFTVYFERRITESMYGAEYVEMLWEIGLQDLQYTINELGLPKEDTRLKLDLKGRNPDEGLTDVAYEKGALLLRLIEETVGRTAFDAFLNQYFSTFSFKTIHTEQFIQYIDSALLAKNAAWKNAVNLEEWIYQSGLPDNCPKPNNVRFRNVDTLVVQFLKNPQTVTLPNSWSTYEWLHFIRNLPADLSLSVMQLLDEKYKLSASTNSEIACAWYVQAINAGYTPVFVHAEKFIAVTGRQKFLEPIYRALIKNDKADIAAKWLAQYQSNYHPLAQSTISGIVHSDRNSAAKN